MERLLLHALDHVIHGGTLDERGARSFGLLSRAVSQYPWLLPEWLKKLAVRYVSDGCACLSARCCAWRCNHCGLSPDGARARRFAIWRAGVEGYNALAHVAYVTVPILYIHSTADGMTLRKPSIILLRRMNAEPCAYVCVCVPGSGDRLCAGGALAPAVQPHRQR